MGGILFIRSKRILQSGHHSSAGLRSADGTQSLANGGIPRDEPHARAVAFALACCLAGVAVSGVATGSVSAQAELFRESRQISPFALLHLGV
jgi:hypothetical protein